MRWRWAVGAVVALAPAGCSPPPPASVSISPTSQPGSPTTSSSSSIDSQDPARFAASVRTRASEAGVDAQLVMAILDNESYKPHEPSVERAWQRIKPDAAFGIANMHKATFDQTKRGRAFAGRDWQELPDDPDLAIQAESWYLHDLAAALPAHHSSRYTVDDLLALGYNTGPANMKAFGRGTTPGPQAQSYLDELHRYWVKAGDAVGHA
jgi:Transglycosylase SLT domain